MIKFLSKIISTLLVVLLLVLYVPYYFHTCDSCDNFFVGPGYRSNVVVDALSEKSDVICKDCAEKHHVLSSVIGKDVEEYRRPIIENPVTLINELFDAISE